MFVANPRYLLRAVVTPRVEFTRFGPGWARAKKVEVLGFALPGSSVLTPDYATRLL